MKSILHWPVASVALGPRRATRVVGNPRRHRVLQPGVDRYFVTATADDIAKLDAGVLSAGSAPS
jgi:hypothetical protein